MSSSPPRPSVTAEPGSGRGLGADRELALLHAPARVRPALSGLLAVDCAMGAIVARSSEPALGAIKLAWWREALEALDQRSPPAEPRLQAAARELLPRGITGARLAGLEAGWAALLQPEVEPELVARRGALLFIVGGELLGSAEAMLGEAGALHALAGAGLLDLGRERLARIGGHRFERRARPLTMLARAAARDLTRREAQGSPARIAAMLAHRWSGKIRG